MSEETIVLKMTKDQLTKLETYLVELPFKISNPIINFLNVCKVKEDVIANTEEDNTVPVSTEQE